MVYYIRDAEKTTYWFLILHFSSHHTFKSFAQSLDMKMTFKSDMSKQNDQKP